MTRSAFLKYSMQVRIGNMDGIFVAYHNTARIFGFQYISLSVGFWRYRKHKLILFALKIEPRWTASCMDLRKWVLKRSNSQSRFSKRSLTRRPRSTPTRCVFSPIDSTAAYSACTDIQFGIGGCQICHQRGTPEHLCDTGDAQ